MIQVTITLLAALDRNRAIGRGNALPWHLPADLKRFKALTLGKPVLMGRRTAESLGRALPGRRNLVLTRGRRAPFEGMQAVASVAEAAAIAGVDGAGELCAIGGAQVYALTLPLAARMHLTHVEAAVADGDTFFPPFAEEEWKIVARQAHPADARHAFGFVFVDYARIPRASA